MSAAGERSEEVVRRGGAGRARGGGRARWVPVGVLALVAAMACAGSGDGDTSGAEMASGESASAPAADGASEGASPPDDGAPNTLTEAERAGGWRLLFDGESLEGWRGYNRPDRPAGWEAVDGTLARTGPGGDIITEEPFEDFELAVEWRLEPGGNSGIFYRAAEGEEWIYHSAPEYQVLDDDGHPDGQSPLTSAGSNYGLHPAPRGVVRPVGEWNEARIVVEGDRVEHWLNGTRVVEYELGSPDWEERVADSKFSQWPAYGQADRGHIGLQDHGDPVWYRNIKIRVIG